MLSLAVQGELACTCWDPMSVGAVAAPVPAGAPECGAGVGMCEGAEVLGVGRC